MSLPSTCVISEGDTALAFSADQKRYHPFTVRAGTKVRLWKYSVSTEGAVGHYYGSKFVVRGSSLELLDPNKLELMQQQLPGDDKDNRNLMDVASNQSISGEAIQELKERDLAGEQLISEIVSGSNTFSEKSEFSKQKYITRKRAKHLPMISIYRPSLRHLSLLHYQLHPEKIGFLRLDTLSLLLSLANVRHGSRLLLVDNTGGLLVGAVLERMGGGGRLVELFTTDVVHPRPVLSSFSHLSQQHWDCLSAFPLRRLRQLRASHTPEMSTEPTQPTKLSTQLMENAAQSTELTTQPAEFVECPTKLTILPTELTIEPTGITIEPTEFPTQPTELTAQSTELTTLPTELTTVTQTAQTKATGTDRYSTARELLLEGGFEGIILASKHNPVPILEACLPFISPSSPLLVYCVFPELLTSCYQLFHPKNSVLLRSLSTSWMREYQPDEFKLHPEMTSSSCRTGYVLSGIRIKDSRDRPLSLDTTPVTMDTAEDTSSPDSKRAKISNVTL